MRCAGLLGIIDASLSAPLSECAQGRRWYAFLGESNARADYQRICGARDQSYGQLMTALCTRVIAAHGASKWPDAEAVSVGLIGLIDQLWQSILFEGDAFDREAGKRQCRAYLCSVFPWLAERIEAADVPRADVRHRARADGRAVARLNRGCATRCRRGCITTRSFTSSRRSTCSCRHGRSSAT